MVPRPSSGASLSSGVPVFMDRTRVICVAMKRTVESFMMVIVSREEISKDDHVDCAYAGD